MSLSEKPDGSALPAISASPITSQNTSPRSESVKFRRELQPLPKKRVTVSDLSDQIELATIDSSQMTTLLIAYFSVFLDTMGIGIVAPILPFYAEKFNASAVELGAIFSCFHFTMMISMYFMGVASDRFGRRPSILYSLFGTAVTYIIQGLAWNYWSFLGFRVLCGAFGGSQAVAAALVTDIVPKSEQPKYLAFIGASVSSAYIVGPGIGSGLSEFGLRMPFFASGGLGLFGLVFAYFKLHETHPRIVAKKDDDILVTSESIQSSQSTDTEHNDDTPPPIPGEVKFIVAITYVGHVGWSAVASMWGLFLARKFGFTSLELGFAVLVVAVVFTLSAVFVYTPLSKRVGAFRALFVGSVVNALGFALLSVGRNVWFALAVVIVFVGIGEGILYPGYKASAALFTTPRNRGKIMALVGAANAIGDATGPICHGLLFGVSKGYPFFVAAIINGLVAVAITVLLFLRPEICGGPMKAVPTADVYGVDETAPRWEKFAADKVSKEDLHKLGTWFGNLLSARNYKWVSHYPMLQYILKLDFPPLGTSSFEEHVNATRFLRQNAEVKAKEFEAMATIPHM